MFDKEKLIDDLIKNEKKNGRYQKKLSYFCNKYGIDAYQALSYHDEVIDKMKKEGLM